MSEEEYPEELNFPYRCQLDAAPVDEVGDAVQLMERRLGEFISPGRTRPKSRQIVIAGVARTETLAEKLQRQRDELITAIDALTKQLAKRTAQLTELERYPAEDPYSDGDALEFKKQYPGDDTRYSFYAVRANGLWFTTGKRGPQGVPWAKLTDWMGLSITDVYKIGRTRKTPVSW